jgi:hypothetical protein
MLYESTWCHSPQPEKICVQHQQLVCATIDHLVLIYRLSFSWPWSRRSTSPYIEWWMVELLMNPKRAAIASDEADVLMSRRLQFIIFQDVDLFRPRLASFWNQPHCTHHTLNACTSCLLPLGSRRDFRTEMSRACKLEACFGPCIRSTCVKLCSKAIITKIRMTF